MPAQESSTPDTEKVGSQHQATHSRSLVSTWRRINLFKKSNVMFLIAALCLSGWLLYKQEKISAFEGKYIFNYVQGRFSYIVILDIYDDGDLRMRSKLNGLDGFDMTVKYEIEGDSIVVGGKKVFNKYGNNLIYEFEGDSIVGGGNKLFNIYGDNVIKGAVFVRQNH